MVEDVFATASTVALLIGLAGVGAFLSPRFGNWMADHTARLSPRLSALFRDGFGGGGS